MRIEAFINDVISQNAAALPTYFTEDATINWHCTNERFTVAEYIRANCEYPGKWAGALEREIHAGNLAVVVTHVYAKDDPALSFHVTSIIEFMEDRIRTLDEYWADDGAAPAWRQEMQIGSPIR